MNLHELLRRLRAHDSERAISRAMQMSRNTVKAYRQWAAAQGLLDGALPELAALEALRDQTFTLPRTTRPPNISSVEVYRAEIAELLQQGDQPRTIWRKLQERHPTFVGSEQAVWRMTCSIRRQQLPEVVLRLETAPGEVAQVDFGYVGELVEGDTGEIRKAWVFVMVLAYSRHMYAEFVFDQTMVTWLLCHQHAFEFFSGVPHRVILDNLKAAIIKAYTREQDAEVQQAYRECAEHYGFLIDPCLPRQPQHKGKVERGGVAYVQSSFMPLLPPHTPLPEANRRLQHWLVTTAGLRVHGTTREVPLTRFEQRERPALHPLPATAYEPAVWKACTLYRDGHVTFEKAYYSAPYRLIGQTLWVRAGLQEVRLLTDRFELVATHPRARQPGQRFTQPDHLPADKALALTLTRQTAQSQAEAIGPATGQVVAELLAARPVDRFRTVVRVLHLATTYTPARLEAACRLGLAHGDTSYCLLKRLLRDGLENAPTLQAAPRPAEALVFARRSDELAQAILGGAAWN
jgi:transposase